MMNGVDHSYFGDGGTGSAALASSFPSVSPWNFPRAFNPAQFMVPPPQFGPYESGSASNHQSIGSAPFDQLHKMTTVQEIMEAKALAASKSHSEAERRRRQRINNHFANLRSLLPTTIKTDKASLLAEVIHHVKELKRQTSSLISETSPVPTETDELTIDITSNEYGKPIIKASICCDDRPDLMPDLIKTLKSLRLKTLKAEITTLGGRVKNVLFITGDVEETNSLCDIDQQKQQFRISSIEEALKSVMEKSKGDDHESSPGSVKRQRTNALT